MRRAMSASRLLKIVVLGLALANVAFAAQTPSQIEKDIGYKVICLCGCQTNLNDCPMPHCEEKAEERQLIHAGLVQGKTEPAILQDLVDKYGEKVLAAPPPHGFNLTAWFLPAIGLLIGLFLAITIVRRWRRPAVQATAAPAAPVDDNLRSAVEDEMKKYVD